MQPLFTIGYEGAALPDLLATLKAAGVKLVIDVREIPASRRPGFSKKSLSAALTQAAIAYAHIRGLGDPKPGREAARRGDFETFERVFKAHLTSEQGQAALLVALEMARRQPACLLCFERDHTNCHRAIVAAAAAGKEKFKVRHLGVPAGIAARRRKSNVGWLPAPGQLGRN